VSRGIYHIKGTGDPELGMMFAWVNSYDKSKRFSCATGAVLTTYGGYYMGDMGSWRRKHTGDARQEAMDTMKEQIANSGTYYNTLVGYMKEMKEIILEEKARAELLGRIFFQERLITSEQANIVKSLLMKPEATNSLWELNTYLVSALRKAHPRDWMEKSIA